MKSACDFIYLASASPRRGVLLTQIGVAFETLAVAVDESVRTSEAPLDYVARLAAEKAAAGRRLCVTPAARARPVLAADTAVVVDTMILGKPRDRDDGARMLRLLSGRTHEVLTAIALATPDRLLARVSRSEVTFRVIEPLEARAYWHTGEPVDKAGGYAIQGRGAVFVERLAGSYSGVMGLGLFETAELLRGAGVAAWRTAGESP